MQKSRRNLSFLLLAGALLPGLAACKAPGAPLPDVGAGGVFAARPGLTVPADGLARVQVRLHAKPDPFPRFSVLALPETWTKALVSLHSATASAAFNKDQHTRTLALGDFTQAGDGAQAGTAIQLPFMDMAVASYLAAGSDGKLYYTDNANGNLDVVDTAQPDDVSTLVSNLSQPNGLVVHGNTIYVAASDGIQSIFLGVTPPAATPLSTSIDVDNPTALAISGNILYAATFNGEIYKIDLSSIAPAIATSCATGLSDVRGLAVVGNKLYVAEYSTNSGADPGDLKVYDTTDFNANPTTVNGITRPNQLTVSGTKLYVADAHNDINATPPVYSQIKIVDTANNDAVSSFVSASGSAAYQGVAVDGDGKVYTCVESAMSIQPYTVTTAGYTGTFSFPPLRPANDYVARVFLQNEDGTLRLAGSGVTNPINLIAGNNTVDVEISRNTQEADFGLVGGNTSFTKGATVTVVTGVAVNMPGVDHLEIKLSGDAYGNPSTPVLLAKLTDVGNWGTYEWNTGADGTSYTAATLAAGAGTISIEAYDANEQLVGKSSFDITVTN